MLEYLRNAADKTVAKILMGILIFSFVGWGVAEWIFGNTTSDTTLLRVGNQKITIQQYDYLRNQEMSKMTRDQQRAIYTDKNATKTFQSNILAKLSTEKMTDNRAKDLGFVVSDKRIAYEIRNFPEFQSNGTFSTLMFDTTLQNSGYNDAEFADILRKRVLRSMVLGPSDTKISTPEFVVTATYNARNAKRNIEYSEIKFNDFSVASPSDNQLQEFYKQHPHTVAETRAVSYILLPTNMEKPDEYDKNLSIAQKIEDAIIGGAQLAETAKNFNATYEKFTAFSIDKRPTDKILNDQMISKIFDMDEGIESELIETKHGFVIIRVDKINPEHNADFELVRDSLITDWKRSEQKKQAYIRANELLVDLNKNGNLQNKKIANVTRTDGAPLNVLADTFKYKLGDTGIVETDDTFYVLHVVSAQQPQPNPAKTNDLRKELLNQSTKLVQDDYNSYLIRKYPVKINQKVYTRYLSK